MKEKEIKTFFNDNNKLNKGYKKINNPREADSSFYRKKFEHTLPPVEILSEYENIYPGTLSRLLEMTEKEQLHRHEIESNNIKNYNRAVKIGRDGLVLSIIIICITSICLTYINGKVPVLFPLLSFTTIGLLAILAHLKSNRRKNFNHKNAKNF